VQVMGWVNQYSDTLRDLGIEEDELGFPTGSDRGVGMLTDKYIERMRQQLNTWFTNILQASIHCQCLYFESFRSVALIIKAHG